MPTVLTFEAKFILLNRNNSSRLALLLIDDLPQLTMEQALATVINSDTYQRLQRDTTGFYHQSARYVYSFLDSELKTGSVK